MKVFTVYKHESKGYEAVKVGFSWPAFFFSGFWMFGKGFLFLFIFYIIAIPLINFYLYDGPQTPNEWFVAFIGVLLWFYPGFYGNSWLNKKYIDKGYTEVKAIPASSKEAAIALAKNENIDNTNSSNSLEDVDEASELNYDKSYTNAYSEVQQYEIDKDVKFIKNQDIWARAYALSDGDENKQKVIYVNLQAKELDFEYDFEFNKKYKKKKNKETLTLIAILITGFIILLSLDL